MREKPCGYLGEELVFEHEPGSQLAVAWGVGESISGDECREGGRGQVAAGP